MAQALGVSEGLYHRKYCISDHEDRIWAIELLESLPFQVQIDAIDIASTQFPPKPWLPHGMRTIVHDAYESFPEDMIGTYDVVHVRNWLCIWRDKTSEKLITNLVSLLSKLCPDSILTNRSHQLTVDSYILQSQADT